MLKTAVPKPPPRAPAARKPVRKRNVKNHKRDFVKHFLSVERIEFVRSLPCVVHAQCGSVPRENHHVISRKAGGDYKQIVALCEYHHYALHSIGRETFERDFNIDLAKAAIATQAAWLQHKAVA